MSRLALHQNPCYCRLTGEAGLQVRYTDYVARLQGSDGSTTFGKASSDHCGNCSNVCPCDLGGLSWGWFYSLGTAVDGYPGLAGSEIAVWSATLHN